MTSILDIYPFDTPPFSVRGVEDNLSPIEAASNMRRTINGVLVNLGLDQFRKYKITISCSDQQPPAIDGIWPGELCIVHPVSELCYLTATGSPDRDVISGTQREEGNFTFYRPSLTMMLLSFNINKDEYGATVSWSMEFEEI